MNNTQSPPDPNLQAAAQMMLVAMQQELNLRTQLIVAQMEIERLKAVATPETPAPEHPAT